MPFIPVIDGDLIVEHPMAAIADGAGSTVPLLIGTNTDEFLSSGCSWFRPGPPT